MSEILHLQQKLSELTNQYDLLTKLIEGLRTELVLEIGTRSRLSLEHQIKIEMDKRDEIEKQKKMVEAVHVESRLRQAFSMLNYHDQVNLFRQLIIKSPIGAFVIHSKPEYGKTWLLSRLVDRVLHLQLAQEGYYPSTLYKVHVKIQNRIRYWNVEALRSALTQKVDLTYADSLQQVAEQVHRLWQTQTVILTFEDLGVMNTKDIEQFIREFWFYLVEKAQPNLSEKRYKLLMFLVERSNTIDSWPIRFAEQIDATWEPCMLVKPPSLTGFSKEVLTEWIKQQSEILPNQVHSVQIEEILENSKNGTPLQLKEYIGELCNCDFEMFRMI